MIQQFRSGFFLWLKQHLNQIGRVMWIAATIFVIILTGYQIAINWTEIGNYSWKWDLRYIFLGLVAYSASLMCTAGIWSSIITRLSGLHSYRKHISLYCITNLAMRLPTPLPYIGARSEAYISQGVPRSTTLTAMSLEVTVTIVGAMITAVATLPFGIPNALNRVNFWMWILIVPLMIIVIRPKWLFLLLKSIYSRFNRPYYVTNVGTCEMIKWVSAFILIWINGGMIYFLLANSIYPVPFHDILAIINVFAVSGIVGWMGQLFFFIPSLAVRQIAAAYLLSIFLPLPVAVAVALLARLCVMLFEMLWAGVFSLSLRYFPS